MAASAAVLRPAAGNAAARAAAHQRRIAADRRPRHAAAAGGARPAGAVARSRNAGRRPHSSAKCCGTTSTSSASSALIPRDTYKSIPVAGSIDTVPFDRWRELGADGVIIGTVQKTATGIRVEMRLYNVRARQSAYGREYTGSAANPRIYAHTMADELHDSQRQSARRGPDQADLHLRSQPRGGAVDRREARRQGSLHRRLRRRQPAAHHHQPDDEPDAELVARRPLDRLHVVSHGWDGHPDFQYLRRHHGVADQGRRPELAAGVFAGRLAHRVYVEPRRQLGESTS